MEKQHDPIIVPLENFNSFSVDEVEKCILSCPSKCYELDAIPSELKDTLPATLGLVRDIINTSLTGHFPDILKEVVVGPSLKKANLDLLDKKYRPVSSLPFLGKVIEKAAVSQMVHYIEDNGLMETNQVCLLSQS